MANCNTKTLGWSNIPDFFSKKKLGWSTQNHFYYHWLQLLSKQCTYPFWKDIYKKGTKNVNKKPWKNQQNVIKNSEKKCYKKTTYKKTLTKKIEKYLWKKLPKKSKNSIWKKSKQKKIPHWKKWKKKK